MQILTNLPLVLPLVLFLALSGCGKFFPKETGGGGTTTTGANVYVGNNNTATISGFSISSSGITGLSNSPYKLGVSPSALLSRPPTVLSTSPAWPVASTPTQSVLTEHSPLPTTGVRSSPASVLMR